MQSVRAVLYVVVRLPYEGHATVVELLADRAAANSSWNGRIGESWPNELRNHTWFLWLRYPIKFPFKYASQITVAHYLDSR